MVRTRGAVNGNVRLAYEVRNRMRVTRPWLVLIQGLGFERSGWAPVLDDLGRHFRLLLLDNRGAGASDAPSGRYTVSQMTSDVVAVLDAARVHTAHVLGVSLGGMIAQELAINHPTRVRRLVLVSTTPGWPICYPVPAATALLLAQTPVLPRHLALRRHAENMLSPRTLAEQPQLVSRLVQYRDLHPPSGDSWRGQLGAGVTYVSGARHAAIRAHTLILHGSNDRVADPRNAELLGVRIPGAQRVMFPDTGHLLCWESPTYFAAVVTAFLRGEELKTNTVALPPNRPDAEPPQRLRWRPQRLRAGSTGP